jgi:hypothetical protein
MERPKRRRKSLIFIAICVVPWNKPRATTISKAKESQGKISKADSRYKMVQGACAGIMTPFATIAILLAMFVK